MVAKLKKTRKVKSGAISADDLLKGFCKDIDEWPDNWAGGDIDVPIGNAIVEEFKPFLLDRIEKGRAKNTIKIYAGYLCCLGAELIRRLNNDEKQRKLSAKQLILKHVDDSGGPYWQHARDERHHEHYDSVCRGLYKFMIGRK